MRVLLLEVPLLLREILEQAVGADDELELLKGPDPIATSEPPLSPDIVILGLTTAEDTTLVPALFARWPRIRIVTLTQQGDAAEVYDLQPRRRMKGQMSATEIVKMLRGWDTGGSDDVRPA